MAKKKQQKQPYGLVASLASASLVSVFLLGVRVVESDSFRYVFLVWNLILAALPPLLAWALVTRLRKHSWAGWQQLGLTVLWIVFLPNSFYLLTDFIHLRQTYEASLLFDIGMLTSFVITGLIMGCISIYLVHTELRKRIRPGQAWVLVAGLFLASSFALCLGRFTRWNTWDILLKPAGLLFDVSDRFINPAVHSQTYIVTGVFFVVLLSIYWVIWEAAQLISRK